MPLPRLPIAAALAAAAAPAGAQQLAYQLPDEAPSPAAVAEAEEEEASSNPPWLQYALLDRFEWSFAHGGDGFAWDASALVGGEAQGVYLASSGEGSAAPSLDYAEFNIFYSRALGEALSLNFGVRYDLRPRPTRLSAALGGQYDDGSLWLGAWTYVSRQGEVSARMAGYYNLPLAGALVLQPSFELDANAADVPELGLGRGLSYMELGLRLRYEFSRRFAPYAGLSWSSDLGRTARLTRAAGEEPDATSLVLGLRSEF